jgi:hypothetical protein
MPFVHYVFIYRVDMLFLSPGYLSTVERFFSHLPVLLTPLLSLMVAATLFNLLVYASSCRMLQGAGVNDKVSSFGEASTTKDCDK